MSKLLKGAGILAICALIAKLIGAFYRIPLTNIVGSKGIGLYQMIFPLYVVLLTISSGGLPVAISRVVASKLATGDEKSARRVLYVSLVSLTATGALLSVVLFLLRNVIAHAQGNLSASLGYAGIAPAIVFVAIIACFRGYYQGKQNMLPSAISQLVEQVIKLGLGLVFASLLMPRGVEYAVLGALLAVSASECVTAILLGTQYLLGEKKRKKKENSAKRTHYVTRTIARDSLLLEASADMTIAHHVHVDKKQIDKEQNNEHTKEKKRTLLKEIYRVAIPVTLGSMVMPLTQLVDSVLVINMLTRLGNSTAAATSAFGLLTGPVGTLINMPVVITLSFAIALLPKISQCFKQNKSAQKHIALSLRFNFFIGLLATLFFAVFGKTVLRILYSGGLSAEEIALGAFLLTLGSVSIVYVSLLQVATSVLQGANKAHKPAINLLIGAVVKIALTFALLPTLGIVGAMLATTMCYAVTALLDIYAMQKVAPTQLSVKTFLLVPLFAGAGFVGIGILLNQILNTILSSYVSQGIAFVCALVVYMAILIVFKSIKIDEIFKLLPFKKRTLK